MSNTLCYGRWIDKGDPVCTAHGFYWSDGAIFCNAIDPDVQEVIISLRDELAEMHSAHLRMTSALEFGDGVNEPAATADQLIDPLGQALNDARDHFECPVICDQCGENLAATTCHRCYGSGCLPNDALAYQECEWCAGVGKVHEGCVEKSYSELADEVEYLLDKVVTSYRAGYDAGSRNLEYYK